MEQNASDSMFELKMGYSTGSYFKEASKWATFIAIVVIVIIGLATLFLGVASTFLIGTLSARFETSPGFAGLAGLGGIIMAVIIFAMLVYLFVNILLLRFAQRVKRAIDSQDQILFNSSLKAFKNYFIVMGIISIVSLIYSITVTIISFIGVSARPGLF